ncbi:MULTISPECIES: mechanosensitive ion channel domain-containing protein [Halocynthiibacter]|uniref:Small-conductance mechanosensitive channel n=1 Tax=Halocynthiibacter halioticoli TaxID=2986804 RepID=A0AAE3IXM8_9RHOB|nr:MULTISPECIES: mechanosensitive ion channel domain-containing protein [Halocynthiibacter]MCV6823899.1 mechanosensitive ion channel [Halocynthiibacter halioticoli]MCW4056900.1 mechanosensitive ion channel [Halocynthiibacter sp. SDUM655004]
MHKSAPNGAANITTSTYRRCGDQTAMACEAGRAIDRAGVVAAAMKAKPPMRGVAWLATFVTTVLMVFLLFLAPVFAQDAPNTTDFPQDRQVTPEFAANVKLDGKELFVVRGSHVLPADDRAKRVEERLIEAAEASDSATVDIQIVDGEFGKEIIVNGKMVTVVAPIDAEYEQLSQELLAALQAERIEAAILEYRSRRSHTARVESTKEAVAYTIGFLIISYFFFSRRKRVVNAVGRVVKKQSKDLETVTKSMVRTRAIAALVSYLMNLLLWVIYLILFYYFLSFVLISFAETRMIAEVLLSTVSDPLINLVRGIMDYMPSLITLIIIFIVARFTLQGVKLFFDNMESGLIEIESFEKQWIAPTLFLVRIVIIMIALVFAYPYIPGSNSAAFQGLTLLAGVMLSLGSNTVVSNMMAGLFVIYRRSTNIGDRIQVGDKVGDVVEIKLMETLIKSTKNEMISIPNAQLLNSEIVNYTRHVDGRGILVHTTVGIGYEEPPEKVVAMLKEAAFRTKGLLKNPDPFVLWTQLGDYAINYEINAFTTRGMSLPKIRSDLHEHIVEVFNENSTQIMTPSYIADTEIPKIPEGPWDGKLALAKKPVKEPEPAKEPKPEPAKEQAETKAAAKTEPAKKTKVKPRRRSLRSRKKS